VIAAGGCQIGAGGGKHDLRSTRGFDQHMTMRVDRRDADDMGVRGGIERRRGGSVIAHSRDDNVVGFDPLAAQIELLSGQAAMARLSEEQREAVSLVLVEGLPYREAAEVLDVPVGTLTSRLARGREALQTMLGMEGETP
jgi:DNA-directed RNA polymerase specialized sigma24 family protein